MGTAANAAVHLPKQPCNDRSGKCGYDDPTTVGTLFHKLKFDILKAFGMH